jgi:hypothetical protein
MDNLSRLNQTVQRSARWLDAGRQSKTHEFRQPCPFGSRDFRKFPQKLGLVLLGPASRREFQLSLRIDLQGQIFLTITADGKSPGRFLARRVNLDEAKLLEMIANLSVPRGRDIASDDLGDPFQAGLFDHVLKEGFLDPPAENAAGHDPAVDLQALAALAANDGGNHSVIAEDVLEAAWIVSALGSDCRAAIPGSL